MEPLGKRVKNFLADPTFITLKDGSAADRAFKRTFVNPPYVNVSNNPRTAHNQLKTAYSETRSRLTHRLGGDEVTRTGIGSDFRLSRPGHPDRLVEVKYGGARLTPTQERYKKRWGSKYIEDRY